MAIAPKSCLCGFKAGPQASVYLGASSKPSPNATYANWIKGDVRRIRGAERRENRRCGLMHLGNCQERPLVINLYRDYNRRKIKACNNQRLPDDCDTIKVVDAGAPSNIKLL